MRRRSPRSACRRRPGGRRSRPTASARRAPRSPSPPARPGRSAAGSRPCARPACRARPRARFGRPSRPAGASTRRLANPAPSRTASAGCRPGSTPCRAPSCGPARGAPTRAAARGSPAGARAAAARRAAARRRGSCGRRAQRVPADVRDLGGRELEEPGPHRPERGRVAGGEEAVRALAGRVVLDPLPGQRLSDLARRLLGAEDEGDAAAEDPLEDRPDERVVRAAEDDGVDAGRLQRVRVLPHRVGRLRGEGIVALDQRHEPRAGDRDEVDAGVERVHELVVAPRRDRRLRRHEPDAPIARRLDGRVRLRRDHADDRHAELLLELRERGRGGGVAGDENELHALGLEEAADLEREATDLRERPRPVGQPRVVAEVDEVLVAHRHEALVQDGEPAHPRVEDAHRPRIHAAILGGDTLSVVRRRLAVLAAALAAAASLAGGAHAAGFTARDLTIAGAGGTPLAATLYEPTDAPPAGGFPAVAMFHGLGGTRASVDPLARQFFADQGYVVLTFDARGHGASGGLWDLDGPNANADARAVYDFVAARPEIAAGKIGAFGVSLGGGEVWSSAVIGKVPWAAIAPEASWVDLYSALFPQNLPKSGVLAQLASLVPASRTDPEILSHEQQAINGVDLASLRGLTAARSVAGKLSGFTTPTLILQGRRDFLFDVDQARRAFAELAGPKRLYLGDFGHAPSDFGTAPDLVHMSLELRTWFDRFLKGEPNGVDTQPPVEIAKNPFTGSAQFAAFPSPDKLVLHAAGGGVWLTATGRVQRTFA